MQVTIANDASIATRFYWEKKLLLDEVKRDADDIRKMEEEHAALKEVVSGHKDRLHEMNTDLAENQGSEEDKQNKMMDYYEKMKAELDSYPETKRREETDIEKAQSTIVSLLEYISRLEGRR